jgi:hypothetical protein
MGSLPQLEAEQDMNGGGEPLGSWTVYWLDDAGNAHALSEPTDKATAQLLAAAPELLLVVDWMRQTYHRAHHQGDLDACEKSTCRAAIEVIAKAGGIAPTPRPLSALAWARALVKDPTTSRWLVQGIESGMGRDPVDVLRDAEVLVDLLRLRVEEATKRARADDETIHYRSEG